MSAKAGDAAGWRRLVALYGPLVYRWSRRSGLREHAASDVVQEVFLAVHRKIGDFRRDRPGDTFRGWIRRITINKIHDYCRRRVKEPIAVGGSSVHRRFQQLPEPAADPIDVDLVDFQDVVEVLYRRALELVRNEFEPRTWEMFRMVAIDGRKPADVATDLSVSRNTVYIAKSRVLSRLRVEFVEVID
jgi:RNA polymerase sigma-70 factor (ECF subfamily)